MTVSDKDRDILRGLAERKAPIAVLPIHEEKAALWTAVNDLKPVRPTCSTSPATAASR